MRDLKGFQVPRELTVVKVTINEPHLDRFKPIAR